MNSNDYINHHIDAFSDHAQECQQCREAFNEAPPREHGGWYALVDKVCGCSSEGIASLAVAEAATVAELPVDV